MSESDLVVSIALGIGLAAAAGFRVFVPLLVMSAAGVTGNLPLSEGFAWLASPTALAMLSVAAALEVLAYLHPRCRQSAGRAGCARCDNRGGDRIRGGYDGLAAFDQVDDGRDSRRRRRRPDPWHERRASGQLDDSNGRAR